MLSDTSKKQTLRIGAACVYLEKDLERIREKNLAGTTVAALKSLSEKERVKKLTHLVLHNMAALDAQLHAIGNLPRGLRMWRLSGDLLPVPTHEVTSVFYRNAEACKLIESRLAQAGAYARLHDIRLSFHPGQYVVLGSQHQHVREAAIRELEYHASLFLRMGYTEWHQHGCAINVHVGPKVAEVKAMRKLLLKHSDISKFLTLENDEFSWSARAILDTFGDLVPLVLDIHHYWIMHERRIWPTGELVSDIKSSWRGIRPKLHHALSAPELCTNFDKHKILPIGPLLGRGTTKSALRAHSMSPWHNWSNEYATRFGFDIMWEGKDKNIGAQSIYNQVKHLL